MRTYKIEKMVAEGIVDWEGARLASISSAPWGEAHGISAAAQLCHDEDALYVRLIAREKDIRATVTALNGEVYQDSCLEFFLQPDPKDPRYLNFELNPLGALLIGLGSRRQDRVRIDIPEYKAFFSIETRIKEDGWEASLVIPLAFIKKHFAFFDKAKGCRANFYKCGDKTTHPHYLTWNDIDLPKPDFHCPEFFGRLEFC